MKLKAFTSYLMVQILPSFSFNLDKLNLAHSKITSIEHITMNPTEEQYMEYYADYDFPSEDYDHIGDIGDLDLIFPTLGRDELNLSIGPMALSVAEVGDFTREYGTYIGDIKAHSHQIRGHVYIVDKNHLYIRKFSYDGGGSLQAFFWVGSDIQPSPKGRLVPFPPHDGFDRKTGKALPLSQMRGENILLTLPQGMFQSPMDISEIRWLSVWCTRFTVNFGEIFIPHDPKVPRRLFLERFPQEQRASLEKLRSDQVQLLDDKTFYIPQFYLDVGGERGFRFQASLRTSPDKFTVDIPNENNRYDDLGDYNGRDILIILPGQTTMYDIAFLAVIDSIRKKIIGRIEIPSSARLEGHPLPPSLGQNQQWWPSQSPPSSTARYGGQHTRPPVPGLGPQHTTQPPKLYSLPNCREFLGRKISYSSQAVGLVEADVLKFFLNSTDNQITGVDSFLSEDQNCGFSDGLCADQSWGKYNDVLIVDTDRQADITTVDFIKTRAAADQYDVDIGTNSETETQILVAIGSMSRGRQVRFSRDNGTINFNREVSEECLAGAPVTTEQSSVKWRVPFRMRKTTRNFEVRLGPPGGDKGYKAITGMDPPFINMCWWINDLILPELQVYRGQTYYFKVQGGDSDALGTQNYHPFYITNNPNGGYGRKLGLERDGEKIFAGVDNVYGGMSTMSEPQPTAKGSLCYYKSKEGEDKWRESDTFRDYFNTLEVVCERGPKENYGLLNWTVAEDTDDVVYYQSYTHENLGWRIRVFSEGENSAPSTSYSHLLLAFTLPTILKAVNTL